MKHKLTLITISVLFLSCGSLNKRHSKQKLESTSEINNKETRSQNLNSQDKQWLKLWMQQLQYSAALIHSDSTIIYRPTEGFELSKGTLFFAQVNSKETMTEESQIKNSNQSILTEKQQAEKEKNLESFTSSEKKRNLSWPMTLIGVTALIILFIVKKTTF